MMQADPDFDAPAAETREIFGMRFSQDRNAHQVSEADFKEVVCGELTAEAKRDLLLGLVGIVPPELSSEALLSGRDRGTVRSLSGDLRCSH